MADAAVEQALRAHETATQAPEPARTFEGENKFQHAISLWRSKAISELISAIVRRERADLGPFVCRP
jgi:homeobox protein cut-like